MTVDTPTPTPLAPVTVEPLEPTTPMKPSEAIRLGILLLPVQAFDGPGDMRQSGCVIATADRVGVSLPGIFNDADGKPHYPACPVEGCIYVGSTLHLNDGHRWSRERIADWLAGMDL